MNEKNILGRSESALRQGFALRQNACDAPLGAVSVALPRQ